MDGNLNATTNASYMNGDARGTIFVFSAPSGAGKTTILRHLMETVPGLVYSISATTRPPRPGERDGVDYFFLQREEFERMSGAGAFAEWQEVHGNLYGTPRSSIDRTIAGGRHVIMDIDVYGKKKFDTVYPRATGILIVPPSLEVLRQRLEARGTETAHTLALRLRNAKDELAFARSQGNYAYTIVNDTLDRACSETVELVRRCIP